MIALSRAREPAPLPPLRVMPPLLYWIPFPTLLSSSLHLIMLLLLVILDASRKFPPFYLLQLVSCSVSARLSFSGVFIMFFRFNSVPFFSFA